MVQAGIDQDPAPVEFRLRSEFASEGLEVVTASTRTKQSLLDLEGLARRTGSVAGLSVMVDVQSIDGRLWVADPSSRVDMVRTIHVSRTEVDPVSVFALRAVEALRGARLELEHQKRKLPTTTASQPDTTTGAQNATSVAPGGPGSTPPAAAAAPVPKKTNQEPPPARRARTTPKPTPSTASKPPPPRAWLLQAAGVIGWELNGIGMLVGPGLELRRSLTSRIHVGLGFDGPSFSKLKPRAGSVMHVNQELLTVRLRWSALTMGATSFDLFGSTGVSRFAVRGEIEAPNVGHNVQGFGWVIGAGTGFGVQLSSRFRLGLDAEWLRRVPAPVIIERINTRDRRLTGDTDSLLLGKLAFGVMF